MQSVTFKCITPYASRIYHDVDPVGEVYRLADCLRPDPSITSIHLDEDFRRSGGASVRASVVVTGHAVFGRSLRAGLSAAISAPLRFSLLSLSPCMIPHHRFGRQVIHSSRRCEYCGKLPLAVGSSSTEVASRIRPSRQLTGRAMRGKWTLSPLGGVGPPSRQGQRSAAELGRSSLAYPVRPERMCGWKTRIECKDRSHGK